MGTNYGGGEPPNPNSERRQLILRNKAKGRVETVEQHQAFLAYYGMGEARSLSKVADALGIGEKTIKMWSTQFEWVRRCQEQDEKINKALEEKMGRDLVRARGKAINLCESVMTKFLEDLQNGRISTMKVSEINELMKTYMLINGGATSRTDHTGKVEVDHDHQFTARDRLAQLRKDRGLLPDPQVVDAEIVEEDGNA